MEVSKETEQKISQLQMFEQGLQSFLAQKHQFQVQLVEIESALNELNSTGKAYSVSKIIIPKDVQETVEEPQAMNEELGQQEAGKALEEA